MPFRICAGQCKMFLHWMDLFFSVILGSGWHKKRLLKVDSN